VPWLISFVAEYALKGVEQYRDMSNGQSLRKKAAQAGDETACN